MIFLKLKIDNFYMFKDTEIDFTYPKKIKNTSWHRQFVQLHKAKGGALFKVYATAFATALLLLLISGFTMAWVVVQTVDANWYFLFVILQLMAVM
jgi:hypothetical protein